jgi:hypothetical protein
MLGTLLYPKNINAIFKNGHLWIHPWDLIQDSYKFGPAYPPIDNIESSPREARSENENRFICFPPNFQLRRSVNALPGSPISCASSIEFGGMYSTDQK